MDVPVAYEAPRFVHTFTRYAPAIHWITFQDTGSTRVIPATAIWPVAATAIYVPIRLPWPFAVRRLFLYNGTTANDNFDIGIYSFDYTKIYATGSTAQSGTSQLQYVSASPDLILPAGAYYLALSLQNATGHVFRNATTVDPTLRTLGVLKQTSAFALPDSMTPVAVTSAYYPFFGMTSTSTSF